MDAFRIVWFQAFDVPVGHRLATETAPAAHDKACNVEAKLMKGKTLFILRDNRNWIPGAELEGNGIGWDETRDDPATYLQLCIGLEGKCPYLRGFLILGGDG